MNPHLSRRSFLAATGATLLGAGCASRVQPDTADGLEERIRGLLLGAYLGDALGGSIEFQPPDQVARIADAPKPQRIPATGTANSAPRMPPTSTPMRSASRLPSTCWRDRAEGACSTPASALTA